MDSFEPSVVGAVVEVLAGLAGGGRALELGIGIGRIALPLSRRGVAVHDIDLLLLQEIGGVGATL